MASTTTTVALTTSWTQIINGLKSTATIQLIGKKSCTFIVQDEGQANPGANDRGFILEDSAGKDWVNLDNLLSTEDVWARSLEGNTTIASFTRDA